MVDIEKWVIDFINEKLDKKATKLSRFVEDLEMDSLDMVELEMSLEDIVHLPRKKLDFARINTVGDLIVILQRLKIK